MGTTISILTHLKHKHTAITHGVQGHHVRSSYLILSALLLGQRFKPATFRLLDHPLISDAPTAQVAHLSIRCKSQTCCFSFSHWWCLLFMVMTEDDSEERINFFTKPYLLIGLWQLDSETKAKSTEVQGNRTRSWKSGT